MPCVVQHADGLQLVSSKSIRRVVMQQWNLPVHGVAAVAACGPVHRRSARGGRHGGDGRRRGQPELLRSGQDRRLRGCRRRRHRTERRVGRCELRCTTPGPGPHERRVADSQCRRCQREDLDGHPDDRVGDSCRRRGDTRWELLLGVDEQGNGPGNDRGPRFLRRRVAQDYADRISAHRQRRLRDRRHDLRPRNRSPGERLVDARRRDVARGEPSGSRRRGELRRRR